MERKVNTEKHLNYFTNKLLEYVLSNCSPNTVSVKFVRERAENATEIYFNTIREGRSSAFAYNKALQLLYLGLKENE